MGQLRGLRVAITGGAQGVGRSIAQALIGSGATVALGDIQDQAVQQTAAELGAQASGHRLDVTDAASFSSFLDAASARWAGSMRWSTTPASCRSVTTWPKTRH